MWFLQFKVFKNGLFYFKGGFESNMDKISFTYKHGKLKRKIENFSNFFSIFHRCHQIATIFPPRPLQPKISLPQQPLHLYGACNTQFWSTTPVAPPCSTTTIAEQNPPNHYCLERHHFLITSVHFLAVRFFFQQQTVDSHTTIKFKLVPIIFQQGCLLEQQSIFWL